MGEQVLLSAATGGSLILWDPRLPAKCVHHDARAHNDAIAGLQRSMARVGVLVAPWLATRGS